MSIGFIKLHRKLIEWEWYSDVNTCRVFIHLLITANFEDKKWRGMEIKRGQQISSLDNLARVTNLSKQQIRTALNKLKSTHELTIESTNQYTIFSLTNYSIYQDNENDSNTRINTRVNTRATNEQQTDNKRITLTKERKERKEGKNIISVPDFIDADLWNNFVKMRKEMRKPLTETMIKGSLKKLTCFESKNIGNANEALNNSISGGYQGLFEPKRKVVASKSDDNIDILKQFVGGA